MTDHALREDDLKAYADGELTWPHRLVVRRHLGRCPSCREEMTQMTQTTKVLRRDETERVLDSALRARILGTAFADVQGPVFNAPRLRRVQDRILKVSISASVAVNLLLVALVGRSDLFGSAVNLADLKPQFINIVRLPIPVKPSQKKQKPPPPPPVQKPPRIKPLPQIKPASPMLQRPAAPVEQVAVVHSDNPFAKPTGEETTPVFHAELGKPIEPGKASDAPPKRFQSIEDAPPPPLPPIVASTPPPAPSPPAPPPPPRPKPVVPDRYEPAIIGSFSDMTLPEVDPGTLNTSLVTVTWEVDEQGRPNGIKFPSTGNSDVDSAIRSAIQGFRFKPAVHNGAAETATLSHTFSLGG